MSLTTACAWAFALLGTFAMLFQVALALGAPWGELTLGGRHRGALPGAWRLMPVFSGVLLAGFIGIVLARAGVLPPGLLPAGIASLVPTLTWVVVGYNALGCVVNTITPSARERRLWVPVLVLMLASSTVVALS
jgi:hypothetical protein